MMTTREKFTAGLERFSQLALILAGALLLLAGFALGSMAHADEFGANNAVLLDPFDPVPQIRFNDCNDGCGYHHCYENCGYRHCWHGCDRYGYRDRRDRDCDRYRDGDCRSHADELTRAWNERLHRYDNQADDWHDDMHEWHEAMGAYEDQWLVDHNGHWHYWHDHHWHDDCDGGHCHDEHHDSFADYQWQQDGGHWHYWHDNGWHDDGDSNFWHDGHGVHHDGDHHDGDHHDDDHHDDHH